MKTVKVPVSVQLPPVKLPAKPDLPIHHLNDKSTPDQVVKAYVASVKVLNNHINNLESVCAGE